MSSSKPTLYAFRYDYPVVVEMLLTPVICMPIGVYQNPPPPKFDHTPYELIALWDTGAGVSCITPAAAERIGLNKWPLNPMEIQGVNSKKQWCPVYVAGALVLPNRVPLAGQRLVEATVGHPRAEILIGMDVITRGDLAISNGGGKTTFSFSLPPDRNPIDLLEKANRVNSKRKRPPKIRN